MSVVPVWEASRPATTAQQVLESLRQGLVSGTLRPGQRVTQEDVAVRLGVSVAPVREALRVLEQEGQLVYRPRRGYFVTELRIEDLEEIYELRRVLEERLARLALPGLDDETLKRVRAAAEECELAGESADVSRELAANRRFHFGLLEGADQPHTMRMIRLLWDSTEAYRATYYNSPAERRRAAKAHKRILAAVAARDADRLVAELDAHRDRALDVLRGILVPA
ncbi:MAG TPA: GntR family transcriptional regulator [Solirubrobacteraceae bacterium]|nr:GntR family transcriptional regulator [Solirubrobacteraceae bacterium]